MFAAGLVLWAATAWAQTDTATISGRIADPSGQILTDVLVRATNADTNVETATRTNADGIYVIRYLRPGLYRMVVEKEGFTTIVLDDLIVAVQDVLGRNFTMELGPVKDLVTVRAGVDEQNLSPAVSTVVNRQFVDHIPLNGRSFQSLIHLTPGILVGQSGQGMEGQFVVNGQRTNANYFTVDGVSANFGTSISVNLGQNVGGTLPALIIGGGTNSIVSVDAMQEFRVQTSTYAPEFGRSPGAQIAIVTKSGTNQFHGTAFDYVRNEAFDARNWFNPPPEPKPEMRQHDFGGTVGGPVRANQTFFFFSYEGLRLRQPATATAFLYTPETRAAVAPVYRPIVNALPIPNGALQDPTCDNVSRPCIASLTASFSNPTSFDAFSLRLDHTVNSRLALFARASHTPSTQDLRSFASIESSSLNMDLVTAGLTAMLNPTLVHDLRVSWGRSTGGVEFVQDDGYGAVAPPISSMFPPGSSPGRNIVSLSLGNGGRLSSGTRAANAADQVNVVNTFSWVSGAHHLKFGVDYRHFQPTNQGPSSYTLILNDFGQLRSGTMGTLLSVASEQITVRLRNWSIFAQDTWKATPRLTLTYGLRWEINTPPVSITSGKPLYAIEGIFDDRPVQLAPPGTPLWRTRYDNLAPRVGGAYQLTTSTLVRGGFGLFHDLGYGDLLGSTIFGFPYNRVRITSVAGQPFDLTNPAFEPLPFSTSLSAVTAGNLAAFDPNLQLPVTWQWNAAVEQVIGGSQTLSLTYLGANGRRLLRPDFVVPPASRLLENPPIAATRNAGSSRYHALQIQLRRRLRHGLQALASYTLAESRDSESDDAGGNFFGAALNANYASSLTEVYVPPLAPSDFDIRHAFAAALSYELPAPEWGRVGRAILQNWAVDAIVRASSALPLNVRIEGVSSELGAYRTQPDLVPGQPIWLPAPDEPGGKVLNPDAFTLPPFGVPGNFPRNSIRSPFSITQTDLALRRQFPLTQGTSVEFRVEAFNIFNHPMFGGLFSPGTLWGRCTRTPCTGQQNPAFGRVSSTLNLGLGGGGLNGGQDPLYAVGGSRSIQFSLKLRF
jgi:hypothetical protein